jgi:CRISPR-associated protein Csm3
MFNYKGSFIIEYTLKALTGLRIGGSKEQFEIGGVDNPIIKVEVEIPDYDGNGNTLPQGAPYVPGSSLKGKMRSLLEWLNGNVEKMINSAKENAEKEIEKVNLTVKNPEEREKKIKNINRKAVERAGGACTCGECVICKVFGTGDAKRIEELAEKGIDFIPGPPRLKVFDAYPTYETLERLNKALGENIFTEIKIENQINRLTAKANPRKIERVPAGAEFKGTMVFDVYKDEDKDLLKVVFQGMKCLEDHYLGGCGSRGSGKVKFKDITLIWRPKEYYLGEEGKEEKLFENKELNEILNDLSEKLQNWRC